MAKLTHKLLGVAEPAQNETGDIVFRCSDASVDRVGDRVFVTGMDLSRFEANPVLQWNHDSSIPAVGTARVYVEGEGEQASLLMSPKFSEANPLGQQIRAQVLAGEIRAVSIGFLSKESKPNAHGGLDHLKSELTEISFVNVPCHQGALREKSLMSTEEIVALLEGMNAKLDALTEQLAGLKAEKSEGEEKPAEAETAEKAEGEEPEPAPDAEQSPTESPEEEQEKSFFALFQ